MALEGDAADRLHDGDLGEVIRAAPTVDGEGQRAARVGIVEGLPLVIRRQEQRAVPVAFLHRDFVAKRLDEVVPALRREATELGMGPTAADRLETQRRSEEHTSELQSLMRISYAV